MRSVPTIAARTICDCAAKPLRRIVATLGVKEEAMRVFVTGANGHIGSHVVRAVHEAGASAIAFVRPGSDRRALDGVPCEVR